MYQMPNKKITLDVEKYATAWANFSKRLEKIFTGYKAAGVNPNIELVKYGKNRFGEDIVEDRFTISAPAANILFRKMGKLK